MNQLLDRQIHELLAATALPVELTSESSLRTAAATLAHAPAMQITAMRVVRPFGDDDPDAVRALVSRIADEYGLHADMRVYSTSFSVRFSR